MHLSTLPKLRQSFATDLASEIALLEGSESSIFDQFTVAVKDEG